MESNDFEMLLCQAIAGKHGAIEDILALYAAMIRKHSIIAGKLDEDCRQCIMMRIIMSIPKFQL